MIDARITFGSQRMRETQISRKLSDGPTVIPERLTIAEAELILSAFDKEQQIIAKTQGEGLGGGTSAARNVDFNVVRFDAAAAD